MPDRLAPSTAARRVIVMARAPIAGQAKTRLIPAIGPERAARLAERLLERMLDAAHACAAAEVELCCAPDAAHPAFRRSGERGAMLSEQGDGDLGRRMARALERALARSRAVVLVGSDVPALDAAYLESAFEALEPHACVFGPALDGGYALVGLTRAAPAIFEGIDWGSARVMAQTRDRLRAMGLAHAELPPLADIDRPGDLGRLAAFGLAP